MRFVVSALLEQVQTNEALVVLSSRTKRKLSQGPHSRHGISAENTFILHRQLTPPYLS